MKNILFLIIGFSLLALQSCDEDAFSHVVKIDIPVHQSALAIASHMNAGSDSISVFVSNSLGIIEKKEYDTIKDAKVELYRDNEFLAALDNYDTTNLVYWKKAPNLIIEGNHTYRLEVSAPGYESVKAEQTMPSKVEITKLKFTENGTLNDEGMKADELLIEIDDPAGEENYYTIEADIVLSKERIEQGGSYSLNFYSSDPLIEYGYLLKDATFDGKKYTIRYFDYKYDDFKLKPGDKIVVTLRSITKDKYLFHKTRGIYDDSQGNPFTEPVLIHENIEKGHGIFTLSNVSVKMIEF